MIHPHSCSVNKILKTKDGRASPAEGKRIRELTLPDDVVISSIVRGGKIVAPRGTTVITEDDILFVLGTQAGMAVVSAILNGSRTVAPDAMQKMQKAPKTVTDKTALPTRRGKATGHEADATDKTSGVKGFH